MNKCGRFLNVSVQDKLIKSVKFIEIMYNIKNSTMKVRKQDLLLVSVLNLSQALSFWFHSFF